MAERKKFMLIEGFTNKLAETSEIFHLCHGRHLGTQASKHHLKNVALFAIKTSHGNK
jgi:hypothetical protein